MALKAIKINLGYNSENVDVVKEFFIPVLKTAKEYKRVSAYYSSDSLSLIAEGLSEMMNNNGKMKLLVSYIVSEDDFNAIVSAKKMPEEVLKSTRIDDEKKLKELMKDKNVEALGYLIATNRLEIKFVICKGRGIFHLKFGIFTDEIGDSVSFSGSINETYGGLTANIEEFKVFRSWIQEENKYLENDSLNFDNYWNGRINRKDYLIAEMPDRFKSTIIKVYKESTVAHPNRLVKQLPDLWPHQQTAIEKWKNNGCSGIVEMATGAGKTMVAFSCIKDMNERYPNNLLIVIGCPTKVLVGQWAEGIKNYMTNFDTTIISQDETKDDIYRFILNSQTNQIVIGTYVSLSKPWFTDIIIEKYRGNIFFIADEAHWLGAKKLSQALSDKYAYRLGLTATPVRYFDEEGTERLLNYFKDTVYRYTLKDAIRDGFLTPYDYHPFFAYLTKQETEDYQKLTKRFARKFAIAGKNQEEDDIFVVLLSERARIVKKATNKLIIFRQILQQLQTENKLNSLLIYVEDEDQLSGYLDVIAGFDILCRKINAETEEDDRKRILDDLSTDKIECVIAMKVLDEGVDIPNAKRAIFVSSSGNPKQFIQRRGRILRKAKNKKISEIYDIYILVDFENQKDEDEFKQVEQKITAGEFKRLAIFSVSARNKTACYEELEGVGKRLNIDVFDIINNVRQYVN